MLICERPNFGAVNHDKAEHRLVLAQGYEQQCASAAEIDDRAAAGLAVPVIIGVDQVDNVDERLSPQHAPRPGLWAKVHWVLRHEFGVSRGYAAHRADMESLPVIGSQVAIARLA